MDFKSPSKSVTAVYRQLLNTDNNPTIGLFSRRMTTIQYNTI